MGLKPVEYTLFCWVFIQKSDKIFKIKKITIFANYF